MQEKATRSRRGLSTARAALQVVWLLASRPDGVRAEEIAETLGKSMSTAYNLLASLCEEGIAAHHRGGVYRLAPIFTHLVATGHERDAELHDLAGVVTALLARTHKRSYLGVVRSGRFDVILERGVQGMPKLHGLPHEIGDAAHALALGKVVLALMPDVAVGRYLRGGLRAFTDHTIVDPDVLRAEVAAVRRDGYATEREEFALDFCGIAAPIADRRRRFVAAIGVSMTRRAFDEERDALARAVVEVARAAGAAAKLPSIHGAAAGTGTQFQPSAVTPFVLDPAQDAGLPSLAGATAR